MARQMKDSGIEWIGKIPVDWKLARTKDVCTLYTGNSIKDEEKEFYEDAINARPYIATKHIDAILHTIEYDNGMYVKLNDKDFKVAPEGSTLMCIEGGSAGKKKAILDMEVSFVNKLCCFAPNKFILPKYLYYYLMSPGYEEDFSRRISGLIGGVSVSELKSIPVLIPAIDVQDRIAIFLDTQCAHIDTVIEKTKASIEEYKKLKQAIITQAVTKGVRGDRPMKDSGIEWIGKIPGEWIKTKIKYVSSISRGLFNHRPRNDERYYGGKYPFIQTGDVANAIKFITTYSQTLNELGKSVSKEFPKGTLTMTIAANIGDIAILGFDAFFPDSVVGIITDVNTDSNYFYYVLSSMKVVFIEKAVANTQLNLNVERLKDIFIPYTNNLQEQKEIVSYLDTKCDEIDLLISKKEQVLKELDTYKKSLIYEYVTGKKEVPGV